MCLGIPGKVVEVKGPKARVKLPDHEHWIDISAIVEEVKIGDYLHSYQSVAINKVSAKQAKEALTLLKDYASCQK